MCKPESRFRSCYFGSRNRRYKPNANHFLHFPLWYYFAEPKTPEGNSSSSFSAGTTLTYSQSSQTCKSLTARTPRKTAIRVKYKSLTGQYTRLKHKFNRSQKKEQPLDLITFEQYKKLTYKFFPSSELASSINAVMTQIRRKPKGRRYSNDFKTYCLSLYFIGPKLYKKELVRKLGLPSVRTLARFIQSPRR